MRTHRRAFLNLSTTAYPTSFSAWILSHWNVVCQQITTTNDYGHPNKPFNFNYGHVPFDGRRSLTVLGTGVCFAQPV